MPGSTLVAAASPTTVAVAASASAAAARSRRMSKQSEWECPNAEATAQPVNALHGQRCSTRERGERERKRERRIFSSSKTKFEILQTDAANANCKDSLEFFVFFFISSFVCFKIIFALRRKQYSTGVRRQWWRQRCHCCSCKNKNKKVLRIQWQIKHTHKAEAKPAQQEQQ